MKRIVAVTVAVAFGALLATNSWAQDEKVPGKSDTLKWAESKFHYVGEAKCKTCHKVEYDSWAKSKHAKAWESLKPEEQKNPECVACHSVGKTQADSLLTGIGCESCHGPGSDYRTMKAMKDPKLAAEAGLLPVTEATCVRCHNKKSPTFKGFDFKEMMKAGMHEVKAKEGK